LPFLIIRTLVADWNN